MWALICALASRGFSREREEELEVLACCSISDQVQIKKSTNEVCAKRLPLGFKPLKPMGIIKQ